MKNFNIIFENKFLNDNITADMVSAEIENAWINGALGNKADYAIRHLEIVRPYDNNDDIGDEIAFGVANAEGWIEFNDEIEDDKVDAISEYLLESLGATCNNIEVNNREIRIYAEDRKFIAFPNKHLSHAHRYEQAYMNADSAIHDDSVAIAEALDYVVENIIGEDAICERCDTLNDDLDEGIHYDYCVFKFDDAISCRELTDVTFTLADGEEVDAFDHIDITDIEDKYNRWMTLECDDIVRDGSTIKFTFSTTDRDQFDDFMIKFVDYISSKYRIAKFEVE